VIPGVGAIGIATGPGRPVWNLVISNVPGTQFALNLAGAQMVANYPVSVITHGMGLNITVRRRGPPPDSGAAPEPMTDYRPAPAGETAGNAAPPRPPPAMTRPAAR